MGKSTVSMAIFNSYVSSPEGTVSSMKHHTSKPLPLMRYVRSWGLRCEALQVRLLRFQHLLTREQNIKRPCHDDGDADDVGLGGGLLLNVIMIGLV